MSVPVRRLVAPLSLPVARPVLGDAESEAVAQVLASGWVAQGPRVAAFEEAFAARVGARHAVAVSSATAALHLMMVAEGIGAGDEVVVPSLSFIATANCVRYVGAQPVFADVDPATANLTPATVAPLLGPRTRAVLAVHQGGVPADVPALRALCHPVGVTVLEDAACAIGSSAHGRPVGAGAHAAAWSFHPRKVITTGEGGMLTLDDEATARRVRALRQHGMSAGGYERHTSGQVVLETYDEVGFNYRMTDLQAAVGLAQLARLDAIVARRRQIADRYRMLLAGVAELAVVAEPAYGRSNEQSFWVRLTASATVERDDVLVALAAAGIGARRGIMAAHLEPAYRDSRPRVPLPATEDHTRRALILPILHELTDDEQDEVVAVLQDAVRGAS